MENDPFQPRPSLLSLMFSCDRLGTISDLRQGIFRFLTQFYPVEVAFRMSQAPTLNYIFSHNRSARCVMLTAEGWANTDSVLIDLYARLLTAQSRIATKNSVYTVALDGSVDLQRVQIVSSHFFYLSTYFNSQIGNGERHRLN